MTPVRLFDERAGAAAARFPGAGDARPIEGVERVVIVNPVLGAPGATRQLEFADVVELTPAAVRFPPAVPFDVEREADTRRDLVAKAELQARVFAGTRNEY
jgi:hypothetical protein